MLSLFFSLWTHSKILVFFSIYIHLFNCLFVWIRLRHWKGGKFVIFHSYVWAHTVCAAYICAFKRTLEITLCAIRQREKEIERKSNRKKKEKWRERMGRNDMDICAAHFSNADFFCRYRKLLEITSAWCWKTDKESCGNRIGGKRGGIVWKMDYRHSVIGCCFVLICGFIYVLLSFCRFSNETTQKTVSLHIILETQLEYA